MSKSEYIYSTFDEEFRFLNDKFVCFHFPVTEIPEDNNPHRPGVYVFFTNESIWKVGKSSDNALKRALQHFRDDTGSRINKGLKQFQNDSAMSLYLFLIIDLKDLHWVLALECYMESKFRNEKELIIHAGRIG